MSTYHQSKSATKAFVTWLANQASECGLPDLQHNLSSTSPTAQPQSQRLKGKARKQAREKGATGSWQKPIQQYYIDSSRLVSMAKQILKHGKVKVPEHIESAAKKAISLRQQLWTSYSHYSEDEKSNNGHKYYIQALKETLKALEPCLSNRKAFQYDKENYTTEGFANRFDSLHVEETHEEVAPLESKMKKARSTPTKSRVAFEYDVKVASITSELEQNFEIYSFFFDLNRTLKHVVDVWSRYQEGKVSHETAAITSSVAIELVQQAETALAESVANKNIGSQCYWHMVRSFFFDPDSAAWTNPIDEAHSLFLAPKERRARQKWLFYDIYRILLKVQESFQNQQIYPQSVPSIAKRTAEMQQPKTPFPADEAYEDLLGTDRTLSTLLIETAHWESLSRDHAKNEEPYERFDDPMWHQLCCVFESKDLALTTIFCGKVIVELRNLLGKLTGEPSQELFRIMSLRHVFGCDVGRQPESRKVIRGMDFDFSSASGPRWPLEESRMPLMAFKLCYKLWSTISWEVIAKRDLGWWDPTDPERMDTKTFETYMDNVKEHDLNPAINSMMHAFDVNPISAGMALLKISTYVEKAGVALANFGSPIVLVSYLYHAAKCERLLTQTWDELEQFTSSHKGVFFGKMPTTMMDFEGRIKLRVGKKLSSYAPDSRSSEVGFVKVSNDFKLNGEASRKGLRCLGASDVSASLSTMFEKEKTPLQVFSQLAQLEGKESIVESLKKTQVEVEREEHLRSTDYIKLATLCSEYLDRVDKHVDLTSTLYSWRSKQSMDKVELNNPNGKIVFLVIQIITRAALREDCKERMDAEKNPRMKRLIELEYHTQWYDELGCAANLLDEFLKEKNEALETSTWENGERMEDWYNDPDYVKPDRLRKKGPKQDSPAKTGPPKQELIVQPSTQRKEKATPFENNLRGKWMA